MPIDQPQDLLESLAATFLWDAWPDEQESVEGQVRELLGRQNDPSFDMETWARDLLRRAEARGWSTAGAEAGPMVVRAGPHVGICLDQNWNERDELITAVQLHPGERVVLAEAGIDLLERDEVVATLQQEITAALTRARFLGLDPLAVELLCQEALTVTHSVNAAQLRAAVATTPTLGEGEGINQLVRIVGVALHEPFSVTLTFSDGVSRSLDLAPFLERPEFTPVRRPSFFLQLRLKDGGLCWPNGATLDAVELRYAPLPNARRPGADQ